MTHTNGTSLSLMILVGILSTPFHLRPGTKISTLVSPGASLIHAAEIGDTAQVSAIIARNNALVQVRDYYGCTPLINAAIKGHTEVINLLIAAHAQIDAKDTMGSTALVWAAHEGHTNVVRALLNAPTESMTKESDHQNARELAYEFAQRKGYTAIVELLENQMPHESEEETIMVKPAVN